DLQRHPLLLSARLEGLRAAGADLMPPDAARIEYGGTSRAAMGFPGETPGVPAVPRERRRAGIPAGPDHTPAGSRSESKDKATHQLELMKRPLAEPERISDVGVGVVEQGRRVPRLDPRPPAFRGDPLKAPARGP